MGQTAGIKHEAIEFCRNDIEQFGSFVGLGHVTGRIAKHLEFFAQNFDSGIGIITLGSCHLLPEFRFFPPVKSGAAHFRVIEQVEQGCVIYPAGRQPRVGMAQALNPREFIRLQRRQGILGVKLHSPAANRKKPAHFPLNEAVDVFHDAVIHRQNESRIGPFQHNETVFVRASVFDGLPGTAQKIVDHHADVAVIDPCCLDLEVRVEFQHLYSNSIQVVFSSV